MALVREIVALGPPGYVLLGLAPVLGLLVAVGVTRGRVGRVASWSALGTLLIELGTATAVVAGHRARFVRSLFALDAPGDVRFHPDFPKAWYLTGLAPAEVGAAAGAWAALVFVPLVAAVLAHSLACTRGSPTGRAFVWTSVAAVALPVWLSALTVASLGTLSLVLICDDGTGRVRYQAALEAYGHVASAEPWIVLLSLAAAVAPLTLGVLVVLRARSLRARGTVRARIAALAVGAAGLSAYAATRPYAYDAANPVSFERPDDGSRLPRALVARLRELPTRASCDDRSELDAPVLAVDESSVAIDGSVTDPDAFLRTRRALWVQTHPGKVFPGVVAVVAPGGLPAARVAGVVELAREAGFPQVVAAVVLDQAPVRSHTLGYLPRTLRLCTTAIRPGEDGVWGEHVAR
jgi:hypothetical protein